MSKESSRLLLNKRETVTRHSTNIQESPLTSRVSDPSNVPLEPDFESSIAAGDRSSVLFTLERAVEILRGQMEQEEQQIALRHKPLLPSWLTNHILLITFLIQVLGVGILEIFHAVLNSQYNSTTHQDNIIFYTGGGIICLIEAAHLALVILVSLKLVKQVLHHTASGGFLAQCYLSTVLLFAGIYTLAFRFNENAWEKVHADTATHPFIVYLRMMYFSVSTATLCGTSTVEPLLWYSFLAVAAQMLLSFVYFTSILSMAIIPKKPSKYDPVNKRRKEKSLTRHLRRCFTCCNYCEEHNL